MQTAEHGVVVLVHGIWMTGLEMGLLRRRIEACGFACRRFHYPSLSRTPVENATALNRFLKSLSAEQVHLVAHSLGGIILLHLFHLYPEQHPGRVVMLGSPVLGSGVAKRLHALPVLKRSLGRSGERGLLGNLPGWEGRRELGIIAGTLPIGVGRFVGGIEQPSDGTVSVVETRLPGASDYKLLAASHMGLLTSAEVARSVCRFLGKGRFD